MERGRILEQARKFVISELGDDSSGHDWWHAMRVASMARQIGTVEGADLFVCELAALLHDIPDDKRGISEEEGISRLRNWLNQSGLDPECGDHVIEIISTMSYRAGLNPPMKTIEGKVVQDSDRLDALGAIGVARTFAYSGHKGQAIYDPSLKPRGNMSFQEYRNGKTTVINHFYEKLLKLSSLMNTEYARKLAVERHRFLEQFLEEFFSEWSGKR